MADPVCHGGVKIFSEAGSIMTGNAVVDAKIPDPDADVPKEGSGGWARPSVRANFVVDPAVFVIATPGSVEAESIGALRTNLLAQHVHDGRRALSICATTEGSGSTFVSVNLACAFALAGLNTLLIDADLRSPSVQKLIIPAKPISGLGQFLNDRASSLQRSYPNLSLAEPFYTLSGGIAPNPQELLASERFNDAVSDCMREFDIVVVDTPQVIFLPTDCASLLRPVTP